MLKESTVFMVVHHPCPETEHVSGREQRRSQHAPKQDLFLSRTSDGLQDQRLSRLPGQRPFNKDPLLATTAFTVGSTIHGSCDPSAGKVLCMPLRKPRLIAGSALSRCTPISDLTLC